MLFYLYILYKTYAIFIENQRSVIRILLIKKYLHLSRHFFTKLLTFPVHNLISHFTEEIEVIKDRQLFIINKQCIKDHWDMNLVVIVIKSYASRRASRKISLRAEHAQIHVKLLLLLLIY